MIALVGVVLALSVTNSLAAECRQSPRMHALDFWLGRWDVAQGGRLVGTNRIETTLEGCAVLEHWRDGQGGEGSSLFYYDRGTDRWKQVWITDHALATGGTKEKIEQIESTSTGRTRFQGRYRSAESGVTITDRTTLTREEGGKVRQLIEISTDAGQTWRTSFDGIYQPSPSLPGSACSSSHEAVAAAPLLLIDNNNRRDVDGVLAGYTDDAVWLSPDQPVVRGRRNFRPRYASLFRDNRLAYSAQIDEAHADGSLGYAWGRISGTITPLDGSPARAVDDTFLAITRCESGRWRVSRLIWSHRSPR